MLPGVVSLNPVRLFDRTKNVTNVTKSNMVLIQEDSINQQAFQNLLFIPTTKAHVLDHVAYTKKHIVKFLHLYIIVQKNKKKACLSFTHRCPERRAAILLDLTNKTPEGSSSQQDRLDGLTEAVFTGKVAFASHGRGFKIYCRWSSPLLSQAS